MTYTATYFFLTPAVATLQRETFHGIDLADVRDQFWARHPDATLRSVDDPQLDPPDWDWDEE